MKIKNILRILLGVILILLIPLVLQLAIGSGVDDQGFNWTPGDFVIMGVLLFVAGLGAHLAWIKLGKYRIVGLAFAATAFLWVWAELAVGVFTNWGS
ncbi:MAG: hypothetical protein WEC58_00920 [Candidatus Paceibacterota bacterium]